MYDPSTPAAPVKVSVAMTTHNGARFLEKQIGSIFAQSRKPDELIVCDDASTDETVTILKKYAGTGQLKLYTNPVAIGVNANFKKAVSLCSPGYYVALADQDDIWKEHKLEKSLQLLQSIEKKDQPCFVYSDLDLIDEQDHALGMSVQQSLGHHKYRHCFETLLYGNFVLGCTILMNPELRTVLAALPDKAVFHHDAWIALAGFSMGQAAQLSTREILYRSHSANVTYRQSAKRTTLKKIRSLLEQLMLGNQHLLHQFDLANCFLDIYRNRIEPDKVKTLESFIALRGKSTLKQKLAFEQHFLKNWKGRFRKV
jgi:glycosyltransferase involved in cell wall biosynthesis